MKKFWWGIFFGAAIGVLLLAPESHFSNRVRDLFYNVQFTAVDIIIAVSAYSTVIGGVVMWFVHSYAAPFLNKKAENLATKQDIGDITRLAEEVKVEFDRLREDRKTQISLRLAALERRFQAHQEAYQHWLGFASAIYTEKNNEKIVAAYQWFEANCLYLEPKAREAFKIACRNSNNYIGMRNQKFPETASVLARYEKSIAETGPIIVECVTLPSLIDKETDLKRQYDEDRDMIEGGSKPS